MFDRLLTAAALAGFALFAFHVLYSAFCAFSWRNFLMMDYGAYTNFLYNLAHGDGFRFLVDHNYLKTHLSFSFVLLVPLVHLWDSPLLLLVVQWLFLMTGAALLWQIMRKGGTPAPLAAAIILAFAAWPLTQSVMLSEFHGVSAYYLLLPWLLCTLLYSKKWTLVPLVILLGLREDAGLVALPMLLYFAVRDRWKTGWLLATLSLAYVLFAIFALYPWLTGESLFGVRAGEFSATTIRDTFTMGRSVERLQALTWVLLPGLALCIPFRRAWVPLLVFPSTALVQALGSAMERQHSLEFHYPAAPFAAAACAMAFVVATRAPVRRRLFPAGLLMRLSAAALLALAAGMHLQQGFFLKGGQRQDIYSRPNPQVKPLLELAGRLPKDGLLLCHQNLAPFFAQRRDIMVVHYHDLIRHQPEFIVTGIHEIQTPDFGPVVAALEAGVYGLYDIQSPFVVLQRGHPAYDNPRLLRMIREHHMLPALMYSQGGVITHEDGHGLVRKWAGGPVSAPVPLAFGRFAPLPAGEYVARFMVRAAATSPPPAAGYGRLAIHLDREPEPAASVPVAPRTDGAFAEQAVPFRLAEPADVEPRIYAGETALEAVSIRFEPVNAP